MIVEYPDSELLVIKALKKIFQENGLNIRVATEKLEKTTSAHPIELIVRCDGAETYNRLSYEDFTANLYVSGSTKTATYKLAAETLRKILSLLENLPYAGTHIKSCEEISWTTYERLDKTEVRGIFFSVKVRPL